MKELIHLLEGDIKQIQQNYNLTEKDDEKVAQMQKELLADKDLLSKIGWGKYAPESKVIEIKAYLLALENYVSLTYKKENKE